MREITGEVLARFSWRTFSAEAQEGEIPTEALAGFFWRVFSAEALGLRAASRLRAVSRLQRLTFSSVHEKITPASGR